MNILLLKDISKKEKKNNIIEVDEIKGKQLINENYGIEVSTRVLMKFNEMNHKSNANIPNFNLFVG